MCLHVPADKPSSQPRCLPTHPPTPLQVELKQAGTAVEAVRRDTGPVVEAKEDADSHLAAATAAYQKAMKKVRAACVRRVASGAASVQSKDCAVGPCQHCQKSCD